MNDEQIRWSRQKSCLASLNLLSMIIEWMLMPCQIKVDIFAVFLITMVQSDYYRVRCGNSPSGPWWSKPCFFDTSVNWINSVEQTVSAVRYTYGIWDVKMRIKLFCLVLGHIFRILPEVMLNCMLSLLKNGGISVIAEITCYIRIFISNVNLILPMRAHTENQLRFCSTCHELWLAFG